MKNDKLTAAVVSAGMISNAAHIPAYKNLSDTVEVAAVCDLNAEAAKATAERHGIPAFYTDAEKMLNEVRPDIVSICTPNASHKPLAKMALEHGANVICEKPVALTYADTMELFELAKSKGLLLMACQSSRYNPEYLAAKELIDSGMFGRLYFAEIARIRRRGIPTWGTFHLKGANGGGALCDIGVHMIDAVFWLMGNPRVVAVSGISSAEIARTERDVIASLAESGAPSGVHTPRAYKPEEFEVEEFAAGNIRMENGVSINFKVAWAVNLPPANSISIAGSKAGITLPDINIYSTLGRYQSDFKPRIFREGKYEGKPFSGHWYLVENAVGAILGREEPFVKPEETMNVALCIDAFYRSAEQGREVSVSEILK